ncbi:MAG: hypothetical protein WC707_04890 [Candidatus Babeliaceae bacterium]|jgi:hypothetical protein
MNKNIYIVSVFICATIQQSYCMDVHDRQKLLDVFKKSCPVLHDSKGFLKLEGKNYSYFYAETVSEPEHDQDMSTAYDIVDSLPLVEYEKIIENTHRQILAQNVKNALQIIQQKHPDLADYHNALALKHRCMYIRCSEKITSQDLQTFIGFCKKHEAVPYYVDFWPDFASRWFVPTTTHVDVFEKELKTIPLVAGLYRCYYQKQEIGKYISMKVRDNEWQFSFNKGTIFGNSLADNHRRLYTRTTVVDYDPHARFIQSVAHSEK